MKKGYLTVTYSYLSLLFFFQSVTATRSNFMPETKVTEETTETQVETPDHADPREEKRVESPEVTETTETTEVTIESD